MDGQTEIYKFVVEVFMYEYENNGNTIELNDSYSRATVNLHAKVNQKSSAYLVHLPAFNIHFYVKNRQDIEESAHESLVSFFRFWIHQKNFDAFSEHMSALGFTYKPGPMGKAAESAINYSGTTHVLIDRLILS